MVGWLKMKTDMEMLDPWSGWERGNTTSRRGLTTLKKLRDENGLTPMNKDDTAGTQMVYYVHNEEKGEK